MADNGAPDLANLSMTQLNSLNNQIGTGNGNVYTAAINAIESHGKGDTSTITNPSSGAQGSMQTMGPTLKDPGYGVKPWDGTDADRARVGRDYYNALNTHYQDPNMAAIAYNWGPGNADKWAKAGGDLNKLPMETLKYLQNFDQHVQDFGGSDKQVSAPVQPAQAPAQPPGATDVGGTTDGTSQSGGPARIPAQAEPVPATPQQPTRVVARPPTPPGGLPSFGGPLDMSAYVPPPGGNRIPNSVAMTPQGNRPWANKSIMQQIDELNGGKVGTQTADKGYMSMDEFNNQLTQQQPTAPTDQGPAVQGIGGQLKAAGAAAGKEFGNTALGVQHLVGGALKQAGLNDVGDWLQKDAEAGVARNAAEAKAAGADNSVGGTVGGIVGSVAPYLMTGGVGGLAGETALSAGIGAGQSEAAGGNASTGALLGAAGPIAGKLIGAAGKGVASLVGKGAADFSTDMEQQAARAIAKDITDAGSTPAQAAQDIRSGLANNPHANVNMTASEAAPGQTGLAASQDAVSSTAAGKGVFQGVNEANDVARMDALKAAQDPNVEGNLSAFNRSQDNLGANVASELPPLSAADAANLTANSEARNAIKGASTAAGNAGSTAFEDAHGAIQSDLAKRVKQVIGTPQQLASMKAARAADAAQKYGNISGYIPANDPILSQLFKRPMFQQAWENGLDDLANYNNGVRPQAIRAPQKIPGQWTPKQEISIQALQAAYSDLNNTIGSLAKNPAAGTDLNAALRIKKILGTALNNHSTEFNEANKAWAQASGPIERMQFLQQKMANAFDNEGHLVPSQVNSTIKSVEKGQRKGFINPAMKVSDADMDALRSLSSDAAGARTNLTGLSGEGQMQMLDTLQQRAASAKGQAAVDAQSALQNWQNYIRQNSNSYMRQSQAAANVGTDLSSKVQRQGLLNDAIDKLNLSNSFTPRNVRGAFDGLLDAEHAGTAEGNAARDFVNSIDNRASMSKAGDGTVPQWGGLAGDIIGHKLGGPMGFVTALAHGNLPLAAASFLGSKGMKAMQGKLEQSMVDLHQNPKQLASLLEQIGNQQSVGSKMAQQFNNPGLLSRVAGAGVSAAGAK